MTDSPEPATPAFTPVPSRARRDGWTPARQERFIAALTRTGLIVAAARAVGMTARSAYKLRERAGEDSDFARLWDAALERGCDDALSLLTGRAIAGERVPVFYGGRQVGEYRRYDDHMALTVLRAYAARKGVSCGRSGR